MVLSIPDLTTIVRQLNGYASLTPATAIGELGLWKVSVELALEELESLRLHYLILHLYQQMFPMEYAASQKSEEYQPGQHSSKEIEFFEWVDTRLFPIPYYDAYDELLAEIPIHPIAPDWWEMWVGDLELDWVERVLLAFCGCWREFYSTLSSDMQRHISPYLIPLSEIDAEGVQKVFQQEPPPVCYFPQCLELLGYNTGNAFLDNTSLEYIEGEEWSLSNLERLTQEYEAAQQRMEYLYELNQWLEEDISTHLNHLVKLWDQCLI
jgi:ASC-1-like (ASCH) protein